MEGGDEGFKASEISSSCRDDIGGVHEFAI